MATANSTKLPSPWYHKSTKRWCITKKGKRYYLGRSEGEAKARLSRYWDMIERGLPIPEIDSELDTQTGTTAPTVKLLLLRFLAAQEKRVQMGDLSRRSLQDYARTCEAFCEHVGDEMWVADLRPEMFLEYRRKVSEKRNVVGVGNEVTRVKTVFKWLYDNDVIEHPVKFGSDFKRPKKREIRLYKNERGDTSMSRDHINMLLTELGVHWRAMALLGINGGYKTADVIHLPIADVDLDKGLIQSVRPKTGEPRVVTLWPETIDALRLSLSCRPASKANSFFVDANGNQYVESGSANVIGTRFRGALQRLKIHQPGITFIALRRTFRTIANDIGDDHAAAWIMGHSDDRVARDYIKRAPIGRIKKVTDHVRSWLLNG